MPEAVTSQSSLDVLTPTTEAIKLEANSASPEEQIIVDEIINECKPDVTKLLHPTDDIVGPWRVLRFVRNNKGDKKKALKMYKSFLAHRLLNNHLIERLAKEVHGMSPDDFVQWFTLRRNPYMPYHPYAGETEDGSIYFWVCQGRSDADKFVKERPLKLPLLDDLFVLVQAHEWVMYRLNELCKKHNKMCYMIKMLDFGGLNQNPFKSSKMRDFMKYGMTFMGMDYCDGDSNFVCMDTTKMFQIIWPLVKLIMTKRQRNKMQMLGKNDDVTKYMDKSLLPPKFGGPAGTSVDKLIYTDTSDVLIEEQLRNRVQLRKEYIPDYPKDFKAMSMYEK